jgi:lipopolysaccharide cholinephosphotransferase
MMIDYRDGVPTVGLVRLQELARHILEHFAQFCERHSLVWFLVAGSALGAARHGDIIPWDDDIDVGMLRGDYERFLALYEREGHATISLQSTENDRNYVLSFSKLKWGISTEGESAFQYKDIRDDIFIDIFPFDHIPQSRFLRVVQHMVLTLLTVSVIAYDKKVLQQSKTKVGKITWTVLSFLQPIVPRRFLISLRNVVSRWPFSRPSNTLSAHEMYGIFLAAKTRIPEEAIVPVQFARFGDMRAPVPGELDTYLTKLFGDYMTPPPTNMRRPLHVILQGRY